MKPLTLIMEALTGSLKERLSRSRLRSRVNLSSTGGVESAMTIGPPREEKMRGGLGLGLALRNRFGVVMAISDEDWEGGTGW